MKRLALIGLLGLSLFSAALCQVLDDRVKHSSLLLEKTRKIDLLNDILPVLMDKKQFNAVLTAIDKARKTVDEEEQFEFGLIVKLEGEMDAAIKAGTEKGDLPSHELMSKLAKTFEILAGSRAEAVNGNVKLVKDAMAKVLNAGQLKAAAGVLDAAIYFPGRKPEEVSQDQRLDMYVRTVLLDTEAYPILSSLFKIAKS